MLKTVLSDSVKEARLTEREHQYFRRHISGKKIELLWNGISISYDTRYEQATVTFSRDGEVVAICSDATHKVQNGDIITFSFHNLTGATEVLFT